ncbi:MAG: cupin domain-containing protein [Methylobacteriaceae bacterium]|jgi:mannose-6-phosphate isomerase-like protein (cupin superfamily)|nr:cupin domain-containing protein [Methylobacteriaceae bacterium]
MERDVDERVRELFIKVLKGARDRYALGLDWGGDTAAEVAKVLDLLPNLDHLPPFDIRKPSAPAPFLKHLSPFLAEHDDLLPGLTELAVELPWSYAYSKKKDEPLLHERLGWYEFIGPQAPIKSRTFGFGIAFAAEGLSYDSHIHAAAEVFCVLAGEGEYRTGDSTVVVLPGEFCYFAPYKVHSSTRGKGPGVNIYSWSGDAVSVSGFTGFPGFP